MCPSWRLVYDGKNANKQANGRYLSRGNYYHFLLLGESQANLFERAPQNGCSANALTGMSWKKVTPPWKKVPTASCEFFLPNSPRGLMQQGDGKAGREQQMAGETNYDAGDGQALLRKKNHVVRKKNHVVRKKFYVVEP